MYAERNDFLKLVWGTVAFSLLFVLCCTAIFVFFPSSSSSVEVSQSESLVQEESESQNTAEDLFTDLDFNSVVETKKNKKDDGLVLYRQPQSKAAVEWYYSRVTNDRDVANAILENADRYDIPLPLAFALAHTESSYNVEAKHKNTNGSIDRGLFQLNNNSFPDLTEEQFFNPRVSAQFGLSHLRFCLNSAGNEIAALAMYNAGTNKVRNNSTPQRTLNYISQIETYRSTLEENFANDVIAFYQNTDKFLAFKK